MRTGNFGEEENLVAKPIDQRTAVLPDGTRLRMTPGGQKTVNVLVEEGDIIRTSYGTGGRVVGVTEYTVYGLPVYTITFVDVEAKPFLDGHYARTALNWINECVAQDDRILMLFEANDDEVFIVQKKEKFRILKNVIAENQKKSPNP
jgi:cysteine synthase